MRWFVCCLCLSMLPAASVLLAEQAQPDSSEPQGEVQLRGPVHEAFAQPIEGRIASGSVVPKQPPEPVPELPPEQRPEGDNIIWIPGYWAWDAERNDFIWVSGIYRQPPPGRRWVPGYWAQASGGWQWVSGYWAAEQQPEQMYVPQPPLTLENGPSLPPPDENSFYVPGVWVHQQSRYLWRPGFWSACQPGRVWIPAHYLWTPGGALFVDGYWDYPLENRGMLFAPIYFPRPWGYASGWYWRPRHVVGCGPLLNWLFSRPAHRHFYFGDYFGSGYAREGYRPWHHTHHYEPLVNYYRWHHRANPSWLGDLREGYAARSAGRLPRPPLTLAQHNASGPKGAFPQGLVTPLSQFRSENFRLAGLKTPQLNQQKETIQHLHEVSQARKRFEMTQKGPKTLPQTGTPGRLPPAGEIKTFRLPPKMATEKTGQIGPALPEGAKKNIGPWGETANSKPAVVKPEPGVSRPQPKLTPLPGKTLPPPPRPEVKPLGKTPGGGNPTPPASKGPSPKAPGSPPEKTGQNPTVKPLSQTPNGTAQPPLSSKIPSLPSASGRQPEKKAAGQPVNPLSQTPSGVASQSPAPKILPSDPGRQPEKKAIDRTVPASPIPQPPARKNEVKILPVNPTPAIPNNPPPASKMRSFSPPPSTRPPPSIAPPSFAPPRASPPPRNVSSPRPQPRPNPPPPRRAR